MRVSGEAIPDKKIVSQVLRSPPKKIDYVILAIEESKDVSIYSFDELNGSLLTHEERLC